MMKPFFFSLLALCMLPLYVYASDSTHKVFTTSDNIQISTTFAIARKNPGKQLFIVAPGYAQHADTKSMQAITYFLSAFTDVITISFRGNGRSKGWYTYGAKELEDLKAVLDWANTNYKDISLLGFSMGAYISYRGCAEYPIGISRAFLVSCPSSVEDITASGAAFLNPIIILFRQVSYVLQPDKDVFFRSAWPFLKKPNLVTLAKDVTVPCHFLIAGKDTLVYDALTRNVFDATASKKTLTTFPEGIHAEHMFLQDPKTFMHWLTTIDATLSEEKP